MQRKQEQKIYQKGDPILKIFDDLNIIENINTLKISAVRDESTMPEHSTRVESTSSTHNNRSNGS